MRRRARWSAALLALAALAALAAPAGAAETRGATTLRLGGAAFGALQAEGVGLRALGSATRRGKQVSLPVRAVEVKRGSALLRHAGRLVFAAGSRKVVLRDLRTRVGPRSELSARLGAQRLRLFVLAAPAARRSVEPEAVSLRGARLTLTAAAARKLRAKLGRAGVKAGAFGSLRAEAGAGSAPVGGRTISGGSLAWGFSAAVRSLYPAYDPAVSTSYNTSHPGDHMRETFLGAVQNPDDSFGFPLSGGSFDPASGRAVVESRGWLRLGYCVGAFKVDAGGLPTACPSGDALAHGIWVNMAELTVRIEGATGRLEGLSDGGFHGQVPVARERRVFADLDLSAAPPALSADGRTVTWTGIKAKLSKAGEPLGLGLYKAGYELDPLTVVARIGG